MYLAYLDPGSGSMLAAAVVAGVAGAIVAVRVWWRRLRNKLLRRPAVATAASTGTTAGAAGANAEPPGEGEPASEGGTVAGQETADAGGGQTGIGATPASVTADSDRDR